MEFVRTLFHEKQESALCAMHCLNNLLQQKNFSEEDLMEIARGLDENEEKLMAELGEDTREYKEFKKNFYEKGSQNISDDGNFSVQTIIKALEIFGLDLVDINHPSMKDIKDDPVTKANAFICNHAAHWFALRKFGSHWFNLNSLNEHPEYVSPMYLNLYLGQLRTEGYTIFVVTGSLMQCEADLLADYAFDVTEYNKVFQQKKGNHTIRDAQQRQNQPHDAELERVLRESLMQDEEDELQRVLRLSATQQ